MTRRSKVWVWSYVLICVALLSILGVCGIISRRSLGVILEEDGPIESATAVVLVLASLLSLAVSWRLRRAGQPYWTWVFLGMLSFLFAGEETDWREELFGWESRFGLSDGPESLHALVSDMAFRSIGVLGTYSLAWMAIASGMVIVLCVALGFLTLRHRRGRVALLREGVQESAPRTLVFLGLTLILLAGLFDAFVDHGGPYHPVRFVLLVMFVLEETFELLGGIALLMAALSKVYGSFKAGNHIKAR